MDKQKANVLSASYDLFNNDNCPVDRLTLAIVMDDTRRAVQGISAITQILGANSIERDVDEGQPLDGHTAHGLLMAVRALSDMCVERLERLTPQFDGRRT